MTFDNEVDHASYVYQQAKYLGKKYGYGKFQNIRIFQR